MTNIIMGKCSQCGASIRADAVSCTKCGAVFNAPPEHTQYWIFHGRDHEHLAAIINEKAAEGWEPVQVYAWSTSMTTADHGVLMRRRT